MPDRDDNTQCPDMRLGDSRNHQTIYAGLLICLNDNQVWHDLVVSFRKEFPSYCDPECRGLQREILDYTMEWFLCTYPPRNRKSHWLWDKFLDIAFNYEPKQEKCSAG